MLHHWMLPRPRQRLDDKERRRRAQRAHPGSQTAGGRGFQHGLGTDGGSRWDEEIVVSLAAAGLENILAHSLPRLFPWC